MAMKRAAIDSWIRRELGDKTADAILKKVDRMVKKGASTRAIQKAVAQDLSKKVKMATIKIVWIGSEK